MELKKPLRHLRLHQLKFFWWDPRIDPREPEYWGPDGDGGLLFLWRFYSTIRCSY